MKKFILTESEKNEIKSLYKSKGLLTEVSDPKNADSYPDKDNWRLQDWQTFFLALKKKWGDRNEARAQFLRYWEPLEKSWMDEPAQDEMDNDNSFFRLEGMWNEKQKRPFTQKEWTTLTGLSTQEEADQPMSQIASGASEPSPPGEPAADSSSDSSSSTTTDTSNCSSLYAEAEKQTTYNPANLKAGKVVIGKGNQGALVEAMQCYLNQKNEELSLGLTPLKTDGKFEDKTKEMTIKFQEQFPNELKADGIIGKNTYAKFDIAD